MKYKINKEELELVVLNSLSIADVCRKLNIRPVGGNYKTLNHKIKFWNISIDHFTGKAWNVGERFRSFSKKYNLIDVLIKNSPYINTNHLKKRLYVDGFKEKKCEVCGILNWNKKEIIFEMDHIDGDNNNNEISNLRILCPNCYSQTETFRGKRNSKWRIVR